MRETCGVRPATAGEYEIAPMGSAVTRMAWGLTGKAEDDPAPGVQVRRTTSTAGFRDIRSRPRPIGVISKPPMIRRRLLCVMRPSVSHQSTAGAPCG